MTNNLSPLPSIKNVHASAWGKFLKKKIYFGHQSVGSNIIEGIKDMMKEYPQIKLNIVETSNPDGFKSGIFAHSRVGKNVFPKTKINEFVKNIDDGIGKHADIVALKFCYIDIEANTDVQNIFDVYKKEIMNLKKRYSELTIIHFTIPLKSVQSGPKAWIKKIIGRPISGLDDNIKRNEYNKMLLSEYTGKDPVFDLARVESTFPNGRRYSFSKDGKKYYAMVPEYTDNGGHLNKRGRKIIAEQFLVFLADLTE